MDEQEEKFTAFLADLRKGKTLGELDTRLRELVQAVRESGKPGQLTLVLKITPSKGLDDVLNVTDAVTAKIPEHDRGASLFFATPDNTLVRNQPRQRDMEELLDLPESPIVPLNRKKA
ncbi:MAG: hypothetical protein HQM01_13800 [Magnetococcales bacterium]|nr:hypothetical protein [Magnetococcales bacterium]